MGWRGGGGMEGCKLFGCSQGKMLEGTMKKINTKKLSCPHTESRGSVCFPKEMFVGVCVVQDAFARGSREQRFEGPGRFGET